MINISPQAKNTIT